MSMSSMKNADAWALLSKCYTEFYATKKEQTEHLFPFYDYGSLSADSWTVYDEFFEGRGKQWSRLGQLPSWKSRPEDNICRRTCQTYTTLLTDNRPRAAFLARNADDEAMGEVVQGAWEYWNDLVAADTARYLAVLDSRKYGVGWRHLFYDPATKRQKVVAIHPESILVDSDCTCDDYDPTGLIFEYTAQVGALKLAWPKADWEEFSEGRTVATMAGFTDRIKKMFGINTSTKNPAKSTVVYELWLKDTSTIEFEEPVPGTDYIAVKSKKKYPRGRVLTFAGGILLDDSENPYEHGEFPFTPVHAYPETGKFYTAGDIAILLNTQVLLNRTDQYLFDATFKSTGGIYLVNKALGLSKTSITNDPVQVREVGDVNRALNVVTPPSPPRHLFDFQGRLRRVADDDAGLHEASNGVFQPGNKTAQEVAVIAESDKTRARMAARYIALSEKRLARQWLSNAGQFGDYKWFVRVSGVEGQTPVTVDKKMLKDLEMDVSIGDDSTLPQQQQQRQNLAMGLFSQKVIDEEELLKILEWPNWKQLVERMTKKAAEQMKAQAAMAPQMPPGAPMGAPAPQGAPMPPNMASAGEEMPPELAEAMAGLPPDIVQEVMQMAAQMGENPEDILNEVLAGTGV